MTRNRTPAHTTDGTDASPAQSAEHHRNQEELTTSDNSLAESTIGLTKTELILHRGPWRAIEQFEYAVLEYIHLWSHHRLYSAFRMIPPAEAEAAYDPTSPPSRQPRTPRSGP
jgi:transposase InsO family protein